MKLLLALIAVLLGSWRASASTGKNFVSAILVTGTDFVLTANTDNEILFCFEYSVLQCRRLSKARRLWLDNGLCLVCKVTHPGLASGCVTKVTKC